MRSFVFLLFLFTFIKRADLGMRMELISNLYPKRDSSEEILSLFFQVYDLYKNDLTIRDESSSPKFNGPGAGFPYRIISVRNFIHTHYASWLKLKISRPEKKKPLEPQWEKYRSNVNKEVQLFREQKGM